MSVLSLNYQQLVIDVTVSPENFAVLSFTNTMILYRALCVSHMVVEAGTAGMIHGYIVKSCVTLSWLFSATVLCKRAVSDTRHVVNN